jgi:cytochrome subunit of sulfide dehydrogenase
MKIGHQIAAILIAGATIQVALAQDSAALHMRGLAATCANCHGTDGRTTEGSAIPSLVGMPKSYMVMQMKAFKEGTRPATVMHQITKGITDQQIDSIANYFAATKR